MNLEYKIKEAKFQDLDEVIEGLILLGCGDDLNEWVSGVYNILHDDMIATADFKECFEEELLQLTTTGGRTDLVWVFAKNTKLDVGKLAMWRLRFGDCSWVSDYKVNYASHHGVSVPEDFNNDDDE